MRPPSSSFPLILSDQISWGHYYAEIEPAMSRWLPWPGRTSRWWFEINDADGGAVITLAYEDGGSGGGFTLAACIRKATAALDEFAGAT